MYEGTQTDSISGLIGKRNFPVDTPTQPAQQETIMLHLESSHKIAAMIHENLMVISHGLGCSIPQNGCSPDKSATPPSMLTVGRGLGNRLSDMLEETNRIRQALGL